VDIAHLAYMANQIARNFAAQGDVAAVAATAQHIHDYWDPRMKATILASDRTLLNPIVCAALGLLQSLSEKQE
jgi:formate dehydrogenase subunit delta